MEPGVGEGSVLCGDAIRSLGSRYRSLCNSNFSFGTSSYSLVFDSRLVETLMKLHHHQASVLAARLVLTYCTLMGRLHLHLARPALRDCRIWFSPIDVRQELSPQSSQCRAGRKQRQPRKCVC